MAYDSTRIDLATTCSLCTDGCAINATTNNGKLIATRTTALRREARICAGGRFAHPQFLNDPRRLIEPMIRHNGRLISIEWEDALSAVAQSIKQYRNEGFIAILGSDTTRESVFMYERLVQYMLNGQILRVTERKSITPQLFRELTGRGVRAAIVNGDYLDAQILPELEFLLVVDFLPSKAGDRADAILPVAVLAEMEGTFLATDGGIRRINKIVDPPGEARAEWTIISDLADALARVSNWEDVREESQLFSADAGSLISPSVYRRDDVRKSPTQLRGHSLADSVAALTGSRLPTSPKVSHE